MPIRTKDGDGFSVEERKRIEAAKRDLPSGKLPLPKAAWQRGSEGVGGSGSSARVGKGGFRSKKASEVLPVGRAVTVSEVDGKLAAGRSEDEPLTAEFPLRVYVSQAAWLEEARKAWGLKSRAETIRRIINSAMVK